MERMTNAEKAREIANYTECNGMACWQCKEYVAIKMAQWKDEQIDTIMLTTEGCLRSFFESQGNTQESIDNFVVMGIIEKELTRLYNETKPEYVYVVTRSEEHADYVEKCFLDENKAQKIL